MLVAKLDAYWSWVQTEPLIVGMLPWHWNNGNVDLIDTIFGAGIEGFPALIKRLNEIGKHFVM